MSHEDHTAGDPLSPGCVQVEVRMRELGRLFNAMHPSPFREQDLDPGAEAFIVDWAREARGDVPLALFVHLDRPAGLPHEAAALADAVREYFARRSVYLSTSAPGPRARILRA